MNGQIIFRKAIRADLPAIIALHEADEIGGHGDAWTPENIPAYEMAMDALLADPGEHLFVAEEQDAVIGSMIATVLVELTGRGVRISYFAPFRSRQRIVAAGLARP